MLNVSLLGAGTAIICIVPYLTGVVNTLNRLVSEAGIKERLLLIYCLGKQENKGRVKKLF